MPKGRYIEARDGHDCLGIINQMVRCHEYHSLHMMLPYTDDDGWTVIEGKLNHVGIRTTVGFPSRDTWARVWISSSDMFAHIYHRRELFDADTPERAKEES